MGSPDRVAPVEATPLLTTEPGLREARQHVGDVVGGAEEDPPGEIPEDLGAAFALADQHAQDVLGGRDGEHAVDTQATLAPARPQRAGHATKWSTSASLIVVDAGHCEHVH